MDGCRILRQLLNCNRKTKKRGTSEKALKVLDLIYLRPGQINYGLIRGAAAAAANDDDDYDDDDYQNGYGKFKSLHNSVQFGNYHY